MTSLRCGDFGVRLDSGDEGLPVHPRHLHVEEGGVIRGAAPGPPVSARRGPPGRPPPRRPCSPMAEGASWRGGGWSGCRPRRGPLHRPRRRAAARRFPFLPPFEGDGEPEGRPPALLAFDADRPPISSTSCFEIDRPRPVPPYLRVVEPSPWVKGEKSAWSRSGGMPMPVSRTSKRSVALSPSAAGEGDPDGDLAPLGELDGVADEVESICRSRPGSPRREGGTSASTRQTSSRPFSCALGASSSTTSSTVVGRSKSRISSSSLPASIFEKSRMSLMSDSRASPLFRTISAYSRCSAVRSVSSRSPVMPMMPFIGVRISWLMFARNSLFARLAASAAGHLAGPRSPPRAAGWPGGALPPPPCAR